MSKINKFLFDPLARFNYFSRLGLLNLMSDENYLKKKYYLAFQKKLDLDNPKTFNEKLQWLKLHDRRDIYTAMVDKVEAKNYVTKIIGKKYVIPTIGIYDKFDDIDFDELPDQFVIKCTHDSGGLVICKDKAGFDKKVARKRINKLLKRNYYYSHREWPYKNVDPRIIVEKYMEDNNNKVMRDYKFFCFNGEPKVLYVSDDSHSENQKIAFFNIEYEPLPIKRLDYKSFKHLPEKPKTFDEMKKFSAILAKGIPHVRVDWYEINNRLFFGEFTFTTCAGMIPFVDDKWDRKLGDMIDLGLIKT